MSDPKEAPPDKRSIPARRLAAGAPEPDLSATVDLPITGYLSVEVTFLGEPVAGLKVEFRRPNGVVVDPFTAVKLTSLGVASNVTDSFGRCAIPYPVAVDNYTCHIENQDPAPITTVEAIDRPFVIVLPVGRPYGDFYNDFAPNTGQLTALRKEKL